MNRVRRNIVLYCHKCKALIRVPKIEWPVENYCHTCPADPTTTKADPADPTTEKVTPDFLCTASCKAICTADCTDSCAVEVRSDLGRAENGDPKESQLHSPRRRLS